MGDWKPVLGDWILDSDVRTRFDAAEVLITDGSVFEIGCRDGTFLRGLYGRVQGPFTGIDLNQEYVDAANKEVSVLPGILFLKADLMTFDPEKELDIKFFDNVVCMETLEHLEAGPEIAIPKLVSFVKPGGRLIVSVPSNTHISDPDHKRVFYREILARNIPGLRWSTACPHLWAMFYVDYDVYKEAEEWNGKRDTTT